MGAQETTTATVGDIDISIGKLSTAGRVEVLEHTVRRLTDADLSNVSPAVRKRLLAVLEKEPGQAQAADGGYTGP